MSIEKITKSAIVELQTDLDSRVIIESPTGVAFTGVLDLTQKRDEDKDDTDHGPILPQVLPVDEEIDAYARGPHYKTPWEKIKANQARKAMLLEKEIHTEYNPIVGESVTDITMQANKGGLANLFRVKNQ